MRGLVIKGIGGFYFVETENGIYRAKGRGVFKKNKNLLMVGDYIELAPAEEGSEDDSVITEIMPRKNQFQRPPIANVDKLIIVFSCRDPEPNLTVVDKLILMAEYNSVKPVICINKEDLADGDIAERYREIYNPIYPCYITSASEGVGIDELRHELKGCMTALAGPSGVGKSTIINNLVPEAEMETGEISHKTSRGRHTTRHVEIFNLGDGYLFDTPGFTSLDVSEDITSKEIGNLYIEMRKPGEKCRFNDCIHLNEPDCGVIEALNNKEISKVRYENYKKIVEEVKERERRI